MLTRHVRNVTRTPERAATQSNVAQIIISFIGQLLTAAIPLFGLKASSSTTVPTNTSTNKTVRDSSVM